jgi:hypothetical protein
MSWRFFCSLPLVLLLLAGCERVVGVDKLKVRVSSGAAGAAGSAGSAGAASVCKTDDTSTCASCVIKQCCEEALACSENDACKVCLDDEADPECQGNTLLVAYSGCVQASCSAECPP